MSRGKRRKASSLDERIDAGWAPVDDMDTPEHHAMRTEQRRALERAIHELPEDMRSAVVLRDIQGCSYDEIADILGTNVGTIKSRISRARARLREILPRKWNFLTARASKWLKTTKGERAHELQGFSRASGRIP